MPHVRRFPDIWSQLAILLKLSKLFPRLLDHYLWKDFDYTREQAVDSVRGSYFALQERAIKELGFLDQRFFIWFEEVDYCKRATTSGWKVMYVPAIRARDLIGRSFAQRTTFWKQKQFTRSMAQYFRKWHPWWQWMLIVLLRPFVLFTIWLFIDLRTSNLHTSSLRRQGSSPDSGLDSRLRGNDRGKAIYAKINKYL